MAGEYDVLVIGAGLAGMTAAMYAARYGLHTGLVEQMMGGAQIINLDLSVNKPTELGRLVDTQIQARL